MAERVYAYKVPMEQTLQCLYDGPETPETMAMWEQVRATYAVAERLEALVEENRASAVGCSTKYLDEVEARVVKAEDGLVELVAFVRQFDAAVGYQDLDPLHGKARGILAKIDGGG